jgi:nitroreductase
MEFDDVLRRRRMTRAFTDEPLDPATVDRLLKAANRAPSAGFSQGWALLVLSESEQRAAFWTALDQDPRTGNPVKQAPLIIVPLASKQQYLDRYTQPDKGWADRDESRWPAPYWYIDTGFMALLLLLTAVDEGLGAKLFGIMPPFIDAFRARFGIPGHFDPIGAVAIGFRDYALDPDPPWHPKIQRRPLDEIVHLGAWQPAGENARLKRVP